MPLEIWGGIECTLNRVADRYFDQCEKNGHSQRLSDLNLIADLGIKKLRYPCLWETVSMHSPQSRDWVELDSKLQAVKDLGITPIAGFLHHGSGPSYTHLLDEKLPRLLADYARDFAIRYPWINNFTPVNEILTTARFSCLYGHWYPHKKDDYSFLKAVFLQCKATALAMKEIRKINPKAKLIQPEDMGKCQSTELLSYQRDFENERRWLAYDILCGKFDMDHPLFDYVCKAGIELKDIFWALENPCPPDVLGINHYLLSNRYLDEKLELYPRDFHGGNSIHQYADVGVLDTGQAELPLPEDLLCEVWDRYQIPIAITEVHTRGHREEQMRWFYQMWKAAETAYLRGVNILGVTAWSMLGTYDWHTLCTREEFFYEPGVFDLRSPDSTPRKTGLAKLIKDLATNGFTHCPLLETSGSWKTERRILFAAKHGSHSQIQSTGRPLLIVVPPGELRKTFARICSSRNLPYIMADIDELNDMKNEAQPWAILHTLVEVNSNSMYLTAQYIGSNKHLILQSPLNNGNILLTNFMHNSLDLLIDGEEGTFHFNEYGENESLFEIPVIERLGWNENSHHSHQQV